MLTGLMQRVKNRWRQIGGALAVLMMFFVPITRAVLASNKAQSQQNQNQQMNNQDGAQPSNHSQPTVRPPSTHNQVSPNSPSSGSHSHNNSRPHGR